MRASQKSGARERSQRLAGDATRTTLMNPGVNAVMKLARAAGRRGPSASERHEMRGLTGILNLEFTGPDGGGWQMEFGGARIRLRPGLAREPRATVRVSPADFLALVAGDQSMSVARMTGRVRVAGDAAFGIIFGAFVGNLQNAQRLPGFRGWLARTMIGRALRRGRYVRRALTGC
jgi:putative sterol carrier protein